MMKQFVLRLLRVIDRFHWVLLMVAAPFFILPTPSASVVLLIVPILWGMMVLNKNQPTRDELSTGFPITPFNISILIIAVMVLVSTWVTYSIDQSLEKISGLVLGLGVYFALVREGRKPQGWLWGLVFFLAGGMSWALLGFFGMNYQVRFSFFAPVISRIPILLKGLPGAEAGLQHNAVGGTLVWFLPLYLTLSFYSIQDSKMHIEDWGIIRQLNLAAKSDLIMWVIRILMWSGTVFAAGVLVLTQSRGSYLSIGITVLALLLLVMPVRPRRILLVSVLIVVFILTLLVVGSGGWERIVHQLGLSAEEGLSTRTLDIRMDIWSSAIQGIRDFPITGMGLNTFREVVHIRYPMDSFTSNVDIAHAHNEFLQAWLDLGLPGVIAFLSLYLISFWLLLRSWRAASDIEAQLSGSAQQSVWIKDPLFIKASILGLGGGLFGHLVFGMLDAISLGAKPGIFFWYLLGLIVGLDQKLIENSTPKSEV